MPLRSLRGNQRTNSNGNDDRVEDAARRRAATLRRLIMLTTSTALTSITTLINEVLRLNGGTVSSVARPPLGFAVTTCGSVWAVKRRSVKRPSSVCSVLFCCVGHDVGPSAAANLLLTLFPLSGKTRRGSRGAGRVEDGCHP